MKKSVLIEAAVLVGLLGYLLYELRAFLFWGTVTLGHDNLYWEMPVFHFFAQSLINGHLPLWNPYEHGGEPFFPLWFSARLLDPSALLTILAGSYFTRDTVMLNHWVRLVESLVTLFGAYLCVRLVVKETWRRLAIMPLLFLALPMTASFRVPGMMHLFAWSPFLLYCLMKIFFIGDKRLGWWLAAGALLGLQWQLYYFAGTWLVLGLLGIGAWLFHREWLRRFSWRGVLSAGLVAGLMLAPSLYLRATQDDFVFPARMVPADFAKYDRPLRAPFAAEGGPENVSRDFGLTYREAVFTGAIASLWDYMQALVPDAAFFVEGQYVRSWRYDRDGEGYLGPLAWCLLVAGVFFGASPYRRLLLFVFGTLVLVTFGHGGGVYPVLFDVFPPARFLRHTVLLVPFVYAFAVFFVVEGLRTWSRWGTKEEARPRLSLLQAELTLALAALYVGILFFGLPRLSPDYLLRLLFVLFVPFWVLRHRLGRAGAALLVAAVPLVVAGLPIPRPEIHFVFAAAAVTGLVAAMRFPKLLAPLVLAFFFWDFAVHFRHVRIFSSVPHPKYFAGTTLARPFSFPGPRELGPPPPEPRVIDETIRYLATLRETPVVFSSLGHFKTAGTFAEHRSHVRIDSFLLPKSYFDLIHSPASAPALEAAFAVGKPALQFRGGDGTFRIVDYQPAHVSLDVTAESLGTLYWADGYDRRWRAYLNGRNVPVVRAEGNFKAVALPVGTHHLEFRYEPRAFLATVGVFYLALFGAFASPLAIMIFRKSRRPVLAGVSLDSRPIVPG